MLPRLARLIDCAAPVLALSDLRTGFGVTARFCLSDLRQAQADVTRFLDRLLSAPPDGKTCFPLLEEARVAIAFVAEELARGYLNKPLPFSDHEERLFQAVVALSLKTARAYADCAQRGAPDAGNPDLGLAMILHRCIHYTGMAIVEHQRVQRAPPWGLWLDLHGYFANAEEWGVAALIVPDALESHGRGTNCTVAYVSFLLADMAWRAGLSLREQTLVRRWAVCWSPLVTLCKAKNGMPLPEFVVDLMQDVALRPARECGQRDFVRRLDTSRLLMQINHVRQQLKANVAPAQLALGEELTAGQCSRLLERVARPWSQTLAPRRFPRRPATGSTRLCTGFEEIHYFISGKPFEQPPGERTRVRRPDESPDEDPPLTRPPPLGHAPRPTSYTVDVWTAINQSANGFRLARSTPGRKIAYGQLLALCPDDGQDFLLAQTRWLRQQNDGLIGGVRALPGMPRAIAARALDQVASGRFHRVFLLPEMAAIDAEPTLIMPHGWFRPGRMFELFSGGVRRIRLRRLVEHGYDYERVSFTIC